MAKVTGGTSVLTVRVSKQVGRRLAQEARRQRRTRSEIARSILEAGLDASAQDDPRHEATRQSALASATAEDAEILAFITDAADLRGWK